MSNQGMQTRQEFEKQLVLKAWKDPKFKAKLLKDPKAAVQGELQALDNNFQLPADMTVKVVEEDNKTLYIVLPQHPQEALKHVELTDQQVEDAAGGSITVVAINTVTNIQTVNVVQLNYVQVIANVVYSGQNINNAVVQVVVAA